MDINVIRNQYTKNGKLLIDKLICDLSFWKDLEEEYQLEKFGGISFLREILGEPSEFINKYNSL